MAVSIGVALARSVKRRQVGINKVVRGLRASHNRKNLTKVVNHIGFLLVDC
jgi:hypothetical protein